MEDINITLKLLVILFVAIGLHEWAHCKAADMAGDPTARNEGRVTLDLTKHFDPLGAIMIVIVSITGFGLGWGKPAPMDPRKMENPKRDLFFAVLAGPICNLVQAGICALLIRIVMLIGLPESIGRHVLEFLLLATFVNVRLMLFNLLPIFPLDGHWLLGLMLPERTAVGYFRFQRQYGIMILLAVIVLNSSLGPNGGIINMILDPISNRILDILIF